MIQTIIDVKHVSKSFRFWNERPASIKTFLVDVLKARASFGNFTQFNVLEDINFQIGKGEFVGIMGRNGAGKSTILKLISGIYTPDQGKIDVRGTIAPLIELGAGFNGELSGYENIFLNASILGFGRKATLQALESIIAFSELNEKIHMPVKNYSSGMLVRLGFSIATHLDAPVLLVDEILAVGDTGFQEKCIKKILSLHQQGRTILLITHNPEQVAKFCSRCILIDQHTVVFDGNSAEGAERYRHLFGQ